MGVSLKPLMLLLIAAFLVLSLIMVEPVSAVTPPKFTIEYTNGNVVLTIKNVDFTAYKPEHAASWDSSVYLYYNIRTKTHDSTEWLENKDILASTDDGKAIYIWGALIAKSGLEYTTVSLPVEYSQTDYQIQTLTGYYSRYYPDNILPRYTEYFKPLTVSGWSETQTLTVDNLPKTPVSDTSLPSATIAPTSSAPAKELTTETPPVYAPYILPIALATGVILLGTGFFVYDFRKQKPT